MSSKKRKAKIIGVPMDLGAGRRGVDMGPSAIRIAGLNQSIVSLGYELNDTGNVHVHPPEAIVQTNPRARFLTEIAAAAEELAEMVERALDEGALPVVLGGDHSIAIGSAAGVAAYHKKRGERIGIVWLDGHTDVNTPETSPSGNIHGMPLASLLGSGPRELTHIAGFAPKVLPSNAAVIGARSVDPGEREFVKANGIRVFTMSELDDRGMSEVIEEAIQIASRNTAGFVVTMDMDFLDPFYAPGVGTPERGGATYRESHLAMEKLADSGRVLSVELTEVNPLFDTANQTAQLAVELILSALGKKIM
ncbi:MAG: arginase [Blastocatellia bacterium AA13]|nr:MAG: arginase [Blastocatellia bacterium AA13]